MQESEIHTPNCHPPEGNVRDQIMQPQLLGYKPERGEPLGLIYQH